MDHVKEISKSVPSDFVFEKVLGRGSYGTVYKARMKQGLLGDVAIKGISLEDCDKDGLNSIQDEINHLTNCMSDYITQYYGCFLHEMTLCIVMEYMDGGSCLDLIKEKPMNEREIGAVMKQLVPGLVYLHQNGLVHRDIKAANILVSSKGSVKLADFGVAAQLSNNKSRRHTFVGTPFWMAPEVIMQSEEGYDSSADIWSLGITLIELAVGAPPLSDYRPMRALFLITVESPPQLDSEKFNADICSFCASCMKKNPRDRISAQDLLEHPFINGQYSPDILRDLIVRTQPLKQDEICSIPLDLADLNRPSALELTGDEWDFGTVTTKMKSTDMSMHSSTTTTIPEQASAAAAPPPLLPIVHIEPPLTPYAKDLELSNSTQKQQLYDRNSYRQQQLREESLTPSSTSVRRKVSIVVPTNSGSEFNGAVTTPVEATSPVDDVFKGPPAPPRKALRPLPLLPVDMSGISEPSPLTPTFSSRSQSRSYDSDIQLAPSSTFSQGIMAHPDVSQALDNMTSILKTTDTMDPELAEYVHGSLLNFAFPMPVRRSTPVGELIRQRWFNKARSQLGNFG